MSKSVPATEEKFLRLVMSTIPFNCRKDVRLFIACLVCLESGFGKNRLSNELENYTSMKRAYYRLNCQCISDEEVFAVYDSLYECLLDFGFWLVFNGFVNRIMFDLDFFIAKFKSSNYCPESDYVSKIEKLYKQFNYVIKE